jgi:hypothetical protein
MRPILILSGAAANVPDGIKKPRANKLTTEITVNNLNFLYMILPPFG